MKKHLSLATLTLALAWPMSHAVARDARTDAQSRYQAERQSCLMLSDMGARTSCLRDVGAVRQESARGARDPEVSAEQLARNAVARCQVHNDAIDRAMCEEMALGNGESSGSVDGGGVLHRMEVEVEIER